MLRFIKSIPVSGSSTFLTAWEQMLDWQQKGASLGEPVVPRHEVPLSSHLGKNVILEEECYGANKQLISS